MVRLRFLMSAVFSLIAAAIVSGYLAGAAAADAVVTNDVAKSARLHELTVDTDAFTEPTKLHVFLPTGYDDDPDRRWPVTYSLAGVQNNYDSFAKVLRGESLTADYLYTDTQARAVSVHAAAVKESLRKIYDASELADALGR